MTRDSRGRVESGSGVLPQAYPEASSGQILSCTDADSLRPEAQPGAHVRRHTGDHHGHQPERGQQRGGDVWEAALPLPQVTHLRAASRVRSPEGGRG